MPIKLNSIASAPWNPRADITPESVAGLTDADREHLLDTHPEADDGEDENE